MTMVLTTTSLLLTTPWYVLNAVADRPSHYEWSLITSLLSNVVVVVQPVCFVAFGAGSWARGCRNASVRPSASQRMSSTGCDRPGGGGRAGPRTCRLHSAPECTLTAMLAGQFHQTASPAPLGLAPIEEHSHGRSTSGTSPAVQRISPRISSATPVDQASSASDSLQPRPARATIVASPTDSGLCPTPLQSQRLSPANSPRSSPSCKLERFFGEQLRAVDDPPPPPHCDVTSVAPMTSSARARSLSPSSAFGPATPAGLGATQATLRDPRITVTTHQQSTLSAPGRHRPVDVHQLSYVACE